MSSAGIDITDAVCGGIHLQKEYDILVNREHRLGKEDAPGDLLELKVPFDAPEGDLKRFMRRRAAFAVQNLFERAYEEGISLFGISGYRPYGRQEEIYEESMIRAGREHTEKYIAPPGGSEHQTGLALDVSAPCVGLELVDEFADSREGKWLTRYAPVYGFILRYPKGKESITGYAWEPWHIRYVTQPLAFYLTKANLTLEEYKGGC